MTVIEKLARAVHEALSRANVSAYLDMPDDTADKVAHACLTDLLEPTDAMWAATDKQDYLDGDGPAIFRAMIRAALEEK